MTDLDLTPRRPREPDQHEIRLAARVAVLRRLAIGAAAAAALLGLVGIGYTVVLIRQGQVENTMRAKSTNAAAIAAKAAADRIEECTTPGRSCYERGQSQTTSAVVDVNRVSVLAAYCATLRAGQTLQEVRSCVIAGLRDPDSQVPRAAPKAAASSQPRNGSATPSSSPGTAPQSAAVSTPRPRPTSIPTTGSPSSPSSPASGPSSSSSPQPPASTAPLLCVLQLCIP